ncbi:MAG: hypothetical protein P1P79_07620, partial [Lutibacter sp.]|nr:hypothetical protein [Lutibacter sp.]
MGLTNATYDLFISDNISNLTKPQIKTIYPKFKTKDYIPNLVLNQVFTNRFPNDKYPIIFAIIRKVKYLNQLYNSFARSLKKIDSAKPRINEYFDIIFKGEAILLFLGQIIDLINCLNGSKLFEKEDNSIWQRAYSLHNDIKHEKTEL